MGRKNSPPVFCTATETIPDLADKQYKPGHQTLDHAAAKQDAPFQAKPKPPCQSSGPAPFNKPSWSSVVRSVPTVRDPPASVTFLWTILLHLYKEKESPTIPRNSLTCYRRREPLSLKKLRRQRDCSWNTVKLVLGWVVDTVPMTIHLPEYRQIRHGEIIPTFFPPCTLLPRKRELNLPSGTRNKILRRRELRSLPLQVAVRNRMEEKR